MLSPATILQGRYRIVRQLGRGGMGAVYEASDQRLSRTVALKQTLVETAELRRAFEREARLLANLSHPSLPRVIDHFAEGAGQYLVMDYVPGEDLKTLLEKQGHPFPVNEVMRWAEELLDALDYLHTHEPPVIHRDIKPSNLKLTAKGRIVLLDFGLAKGSAGQMTQATSSQSILGYSPHFAPLEQIQGDKTTPRSDLYALAATLYNLLTNRVPPDALTRATALLNDEDDPLRPPNELNHEVSSPVSSVLMQSLALRPAQRPISASEMRKLLIKDSPNKITSNEDNDSDELTLLRRNVVIPIQQGRRSFFPWVVGGVAVLLASIVFLIFNIFPRSPGLSTSGAISAPSGIPTSPTSSGGTPTTLSEVRTASGLKYIDIREGTGPSPQRGQTVTVHYTGALEDGNKFDSSYDRGTPADFRIGVGAVIKGWDEGLMSMNVGGKRKLIIPPALGYGSQGRPPGIPGDSTLVYDVELLNVTGSSINEDIRNVDFKNVRYPLKLNGEEFDGDEQKFKKVQFGDLDGDGLDEAAVVVDWWFTQGSGSGARGYIYTLKTGKLTLLTVFDNTSKMDKLIAAKIENSQLISTKCIENFSDEDRAIETTRYRLRGKSLIRIERK